MQLYGAVLRGSQSLRKVERELIALVVSRLNDCHY
jgi:alkylhydroperoxidase family enzyme